MDQRRREDQAKASSAASTAGGGGGGGSPFPGRSSLSGAGDSSPFPGSASHIASTVAAAIDPSSPLPPYMSPASLEDASIRSANLPESPQSPPRPDFRPQMPMPPPAYATEQQRSTVPSTTAGVRDQQVNSIGIAPPTPTGGLSHPSSSGATTAGLPSSEIIGRLDQVLSQQRSFSNRLDGVEQRIDTSAQENEQRTKVLLESFREDSKKTQEVFMNRINSDIRGMRTTIDKVLVEQRSLKQKQDTQELKFSDMSNSRNEMSEKMLTLEKTTSIRAQNLETTQKEATINQSRRIDSVIDRLNSERDEFMQGQQQQQGQGGPSNANSNGGEQAAMNARMMEFEKHQIERMAAFEDYQREQLVDALKDQQQQNQAGSPSQQRGGVNGGETERQLQERLNEAQSRKEQLLNQLSEMQHQEDAYHGRSSSSSDGPQGNGQRSGPGGGSPPPPFGALERTSQQQQQQQQQQQGSPSESYGAPPSSPNGVNDRNNGGSRQHQRQPQFEDDHVEDEFEEEEEEEEPPRRSMLRDRLGKASGEEMYKPKNSRRDGPVDDFDDDDMLSEEDERQFQHERMMRRDPVSPPVAMGPQRGGGAGSAPRQQQQQRGEQRGGQRDRFNDDSRRNGGGRPSSPNMMHSDPEFLDDAEADSVQQKLGSMRAFKGDEPLQSKSLFGNDPIGNKKSNGRNNPSRKNQAGPPAAAGKKLHRTRELTPPPASNPILDRKLEHFLKETLKDGNKPHFDKEMENLLLEKYQPLKDYGWLTPPNVTFLRSVLCTFLEHKGCQVEMDLREASPKALREWDQLLDLLSNELYQWTNETPEIIQEPNNQWGIYGSKNVRMKTTTTPTNNNNNANNGGPQQQGMTKEEMLRRKRRNDKAFHVSTDPSDVNHRML